MPHNRTSPSVCQQCGKEFLGWRQSKSRDLPRFCSLACRYPGMARPLAERMAEKTAVRPVGCWLWTGTLDRDGYGLLCVSGRNRRAHRLAYELANGPIPAGLMVRHRCDTPGCVRPDHLTIGTALDNSTDMVVRGRQASGERNAAFLRPERIARGERIATAKLTACQVAHIRARYTAGGISQPALAVEFGVSTKTIHAILRRRAWAHLP